MWRARGLNAHTDGGHECSPPPRRAPSTPNPSLHASVAAAGWTRVDASPRRAPAPGRPVADAGHRHVLSSAHPVRAPAIRAVAPAGRSEEHTSELQSLMRISYAVFCLKKKKTIKNDTENA